ncbi:serine/threonine-protein kinase [Pleionea mediterranea]|uniref:Serine/threonine protein kinase n=1 Tax=Pleionea mediterranea TaxID=523701 RepID=A0A316G0M8_9GAMM|nr:serine/threonine-protein kinase [Pleionea mediterranea]PWK54358.1 serine/threonine protein kinase [Pleionea mediterranea]
MIRCTQCGSNNPIFNTHCSECESVLTFPETSYDPQDERLQKSSFDESSLDESASKDISSKQSKPKKSTAEENTSVHSKPDNTLPHDSLEIDDLQVKSDVSNTESIAEFSIIKKIGEGGMGKVFLANDTVLNRKVALKTLSEEKLSPKMTQRIIEEARLASVLNHDNIATVYSASNSGSIPYIAMEWVEGESLENGIFQEKFTYQQSLSIAAQIAKALKHAHAHGIIHRDIKPANIMVCRNTGKVKVLDFGIAERFQADHISAPIELETSVSSRQTSLGVLEGTIAYMSPEQTQQKTLSLASDVFSFGIVLHELMTGDNPFEAETVKSTLNNIQQKNNFDPSLKGLSGELKKLIIDCLSKTSEQRPAFEQIELILNKLHQAEVDRTLKNRSYWTSSWRLPAIITGLIFLVASSAFYLLKPILSDRDHIFAQGKKLAVLPFDNLSADPMIDIFSKGLTFDLSNQLSEISSENNSWVIPASEFFKLKDTSTSEVYRKHNVDWVIKGSVQHFGNERLLSVQLLNASDSRVVKVFKESFTVETAFVAQNKIKQSIVQLLGWQQASKQPNNKSPVSEAYLHYLNGMGYLYRYDYKDNLSEAISNLQKSIDIDASFEPAYYHLAEAYIRKAKHDSDALTLTKAVELSKSAIDRFNSSSAYSLSGMANYRASQYTKSEQHFKKALQLDEKNDKAYYGLARLMQAINKNEQAEQYFRQAIALNENWIYWNYLAYLYYQTNRLDDAKQAYKQVALMTPNNVFGFQMLGAIAVSEGDFVQAEKSFEASVKREPDNAYNHSNLATAYFYQTKYHLATKSNERAVELNPDSYILQANLADSYRWEGKDLQAKVTYEKAISLVNKLIEQKSNNISLKVRKASYLAKSGMVKPALALLPTDSLIDSKAYVLIWASNVYELAGNRDKVAEYLTAAINKGYDLKNLRNEPEFDRFFSSDIGNQFLKKYQ